MKISIEQCKYLIDYCNNEGKSVKVIIDSRGNKSFLNKWSDKRTSGRYNSIQHIDIPTDIRNIIIDYCKTNLKLEISKINCQIIKYEEGGFFKKHQDRVAQTKNTDWLWNLNIRLNDDYEGGEFYLENSLYHKPIGKIYHYKSSDWHEVKKVTKGIRYIAAIYITEKDVINDLNIKSLT